MTRINCTLQMEMNNNEGKRKIICFMHTMLATNFIGQDYNLPVLNATKLIKTFHKLCN
jgi:hypothetical protein